jgi:hypothetical protein
MKDYTDYEGEETPNAGETLFWCIVILCGVVGVVTLAQEIVKVRAMRFVVVPQLVKQAGQSTIVGGCDDSLWHRVYNPERLIVHNICASVTGTIVDATNGKHKDGVRHEADGDCHGWIKLDAGQEKYLNAGNFSDEDGNLVYEIVCLYKVTQKDAVASCAGYTNKVKLAPIGAHVRISGSWVQDTNHSKWNELHPVSSIEVLK